MKSNTYFLENCYLGQNCHYEFGLLLSRISAYNKFKKGKIQND